MINYGLIEEFGPPEGALFPYSGYGEGNFSFFGALTPAKGSDKPCVVGQDQNPRRERIISVKLDDIVNLMSGLYIVKLPKEIPADAKAVRIFDNKPSNSICIVVEHPNFPAVSIGTMIPRYEIQVNLIEVSTEQAPLADNSYDQDAPAYIPDEREI